MLLRMWIMLIAIERHPAGALEDFFVARPKSVDDHADE